MWIILKQVFCLGVLRFGGGVVFCSIHIQIQLTDYCMSVHFHLWIYISNYLQIFRGSFVLKFKWGIWRRKENIWECYFENMTRRIFEEKSDTCKFNETSLSEDGRITFPERWIPTNVIKKIKNTCSGITCIQLLQTFYWCLTFMGLKEGTLLQPNTIL